MAYTNIALTKFISQEKNDALPNSQGLNAVGNGPLVADSSGVITALTPGAAGTVLTAQASGQPQWATPSASGAPTGAIYWVGSSTGATGLTAEVDLGTTLTSGLVKVSVAGSPSLATPATATAGTDYYAPDAPTRLFDSSGTDNNVAMGKDFVSGDFTSITDSVFVGANITLGTTSSSSVYIGSNILDGSTLTGGNNTIVGENAGDGVTSGGGLTLFGYRAAIGATIDDSVVIGSRALQGAGTTGTVLNSTIIGDFAGSGIQGDITNSVIIDARGIAAIGAAFSLVDCVTLGSSAGPGGSPRTITNAIAIGADAQLTANNSCTIGAPSADMKVSIAGGIPTHTMHLFNGSTIGASLAIEGSVTVPAAPLGGIVLHTNSGGEPNITTALSNSSGIVPTMDGTLAAGTMLYGVSTSTMRLNRLTLGSVGQGLLVGGSSAPVWGTVANPAATYIVKTADASLSNEFALSTLSTGLVKVTTSTGDLTTATAGTDYVAPSTILTSIVSAGAQQGSLLIGAASANTVSKLNPGTSGHVLTSNGTSADPSWQAPSGLPTIPGSGGPYRLTTWNGAAAWACTSPYITRAIFSANNSNWPTPSSATNGNLTFLDDQPRSLYALRPAGASDLLAGMETGMYGFNPTTTGQKIYFSVYYISGWDTAGGNVGFIGMCNPATIVTQNITAPYQPSAGSWTGYFTGRVQAPNFKYSDNSTDTNTNFSGWNSNINGTILSCGYDTTTDEVTFWQHNASTGALMATTLPITTSGSVQSQTNLVPMIGPAANGPVSADTKLQVLSAGYPALSGWTYFYAR
jgi:hypothetical protein